MLEFWLVFAGISIVVGLLVWGGVWLLGRFGIEVVDSGDPTDPGSLTSPANPGNPASPLHPLNLP